MSGKKLMGALIVWAVVGATLGFLAWRFPSRSEKYPVQKIIQGVIGAELFGWFVLLFFHPPWPLVVASIAAIAGGFFSPYSCRECPASSPAPYDSY